MSSFSAMFAADDVRTIARQACRIAALEAEVADLRRQLAEKQKPKPTPKPKPAPKPKPTPKPAPKPEPQPELKAVFKADTVCERNMYLLEIVKRTPKMVFIKETHFNIESFHRRRINNDKGIEFFKHDEQWYYASWFHSPTADPPATTQHPPEWMRGGKVLMVGQKYYVEEFLKKGTKHTVLKVVQRGSGFVTLRDFNGREFLKKIRVAEPLPVGTPGRGAWRPEWVDFTNDRALPEGMARGLMRGINRVTGGYHYNW